MLLYILYTVCKRVSNWAETNGGILLYMACVISNRGHQGKFSFEKNEKEWRKHFFLQHLKFYLFGSINVSSLVLFHFKTRVVFDIRISTLHHWNLHLHMRFVKYRSNYLGTGWYFSSTYVNSNFHLRRKIAREFKSMK